MNKVIPIALAVLFLLPLSLIAQIKKPSLSPRIETTTSVGFVNVELDYGQPGVKGRKIFGGLVPYGKVWRTGANSSTKISFDADIKLANHNIPAGDYALYTIPGEEEWTIIIHKNIELWGAGNYNATDDLVRFTVPVVKLNDIVETFTIHFESFHTNGADMVIAWDNTKVAIPAIVDSDSRIFEEIEQKVLKAEGEITAQTYFSAAQFYHSKGKDLKQAANWFDKAIELRPEAFWYVYSRAELAYEMKDYDVSRNHIEKCLAGAKASESGDYGYIGKCQLLLEKLEGK